MIELKANIVRNDTQGEGHFGASRGSRKHNGLDLLCLPGLPIYATDVLHFVRFARPYADKAINGGLWENPDGAKVKIFYCNPVTTVKTFFPGDIIAYCDNVARFYNNKMMPHVHVQLYNEKNEIIDPTSKIRITD